MTKAELKQYLKRNDIVIDGNVATWSIALDGQISGTYHGVFKFKCFLTPSEKLASSRMYRELLGPNAALAFKHEDDLALTFAQLKYRIIAAPPFWNSAIGIMGEVGNIPDENVLNSIFDAAMASELKYFAQLQDKKEKELEKAKKSAEKLLAQKEGGEVSPVESGE